MKDMYDSFSRVLILLGESSEQVTRAHYHHLRKEPYAPILEDALVPMVRAGRALSELVGEATATDKPESSKRSKLELLKEALLVANNMENAVREAVETMASRKYTESQVADMITLNKVAEALSHVPFLRATLGEFLSDCASDITRKGQG